MFKFTTVLPLAITFLILSPGLLSAQANTVSLTGEADSTDLAEISEIRREIEQVELDMDVNALRKLRRHFTEDIAMMPGNLVVRGSDEIIAFHEDLYTKFDSFDVKFTIESIHVLGGLAIERGHTSGSVDPVDGPPRKSSGSYLYVYERDENNKWKIHRMSW